MKVCVEAHGCRLNRAEADAVADRVRGMGGRLVQEPAEADVYWLHTCAVTHKADADARKAVRRAVRARPGVRVVLSGCYAELSPRSCEALPNVVAVVGTRAKTADAIARVLDAAARVDVPSPRLARRVGPLGTGVRRGGKVGDVPEVGALPATLPEGRARAALRVQDGCNHACAYCIVPRVRGPSRSLALEDAVARARKLERAGAVELVLTGAHLGGWGRDCKPRRSLPELLSALLAGTSRVRIRLSSLDPHEVGDDLIELLAESPRICPHLHLPLQSGSDRVLARMRRAYAARAFTRVTSRVRARVPDCTIGTDVIVGFPGEDEADFARTLACLAESPVDYLHVFTFSPRPGTAAAGMTGRPDPRVCARRRDRLEALGRSRAASLRARWVGRAVEVVPHVRPRGGRHLGVSSAFVTYEIPAPPAGAMGRVVRGVVAECGRRILRPFHHAPPVDAAATHGGGKGRGSGILPWDAA